MVSLLGGGGGGAMNAGLPGPHYRMIPFSMNKMSLKKIHENKLGVYYAYAVFERKILFCAAFRCICFNIILLIYIIAMVRG